MVSGYLHIYDKPEDADKLYFFTPCVNNLATYLTLAEKLPVPRRSPIPEKLP